MSDKLFAELQKDAEFKSIVLDLAGYMAKKNAAKLLEEKETEIQEKPVSKKGPHWHCYVCGWDKEIPPHANPKAPRRCGKCKSPYWQQMPASGPHDPNCEDCNQELDHLKKEAEKTNKILESLGR